MNKKTKAAVFSVLILSFLVLNFTASFAQERGLALYNKLARSRGLVSFEGIRGVQWTPDGEGYIITEDNTYKKVDFKTENKENLFDDEKIISAYNKLTGKNVTQLPFYRGGGQSGQMRRFRRGGAYRFIENATKIMFREDRNTKVFVYDIASGEMKMFKVREPVIGVRGRAYPEEFSPDFKYTAYAKDFNLYLRNIERDREEALTTDGHEDLRNAWPDWVYPEELGQYDVFWWSPNSDKIAYMQFDEHPVKKYPIVHDASFDFYAEMESYPKAGANNPIVKFFIIDINSKKKVLIDTGIETNVYLYNGQWTNDGKEFTLKRMNRLQNMIELLAADPETGKTRVILTEEEPCYFNERNNLHFLSDGKRFLWTSEVFGWNEIYMYDMSGKLIKQLTNKKLPVGGIVEIDEVNEWVYFTGYETRGCESHLYRVKFDGSKFKKLTKGAGSHNVNVSPGGKYFVDNFSSWDNPGEVKLYSGDGKLVKELGKSVITDELKNLKLVKPEHFTFKSADGKDDIDGILYKPADFDPNKKYPVIYSVYGGPGARMIRNSWNMTGADQRLAQLGFLILRTDHSGVSRRGKAFETKMYMKLGQVELADHAAAVKHISKRKYVDATRVGIYGHSYGGYMTCIALLKEPDVFHVGVAGAPVTDWRNYDSIYTERFMRRPQDNLEGYELGSCMKYASDLKGKLFIHHGATDDNVHPGNTIQLVYALLEAGKRFDMKIYPEQRHGIRYSQYGQDRLDYFVRHLKPETHDEWFDQEN